VDKISIFLDEDVYPALSTILQKRGYDVVHAQEIERKGRTDLEQLEFAVEHHRCLISFNVKDYVLLHNQFAREGKNHFGIIVSRQRPIGETLRRLLIVLQKFTKGTMKNRIVFLSQDV
jgi:predicted nuclease of predicted toxin-antitoxin system